MGKNPKAEAFLGQQAKRLSGPAKLPGQKAKRGSISAGLSA
jgi:hypothetical protein